MTPTCPPDYSGAVFAIVGAAVTLGGLLLVFLGFLYSKASAFPTANTSDAVISRYKTVAAWGLIPFVLSLAIAVIGTAYYWTASKAQLANGVFALFVATCVLTAIYGVIASRYL